MLRTKPATRCSQSNVCNDLLPQVNIRLRAVCGAVCQHLAVTGMLSRPQQDAIWSYVHCECQAVNGMQEDEEVGGEGEWGDLVQARYRRMMVLAVSLPLLQQASGINSITFYSSSVSPMLLAWCSHWTPQAVTDRLA